MNQGQTDPSVQFLARGAGYSLFLTPGEAVLSLHSPHPIQPNPEVFVPRIHANPPLRIPSQLPRPAWCVCNSSELTWQPTPSALILYPARVITSSATIRRNGIRMCPPIQKFATAISIPASILLYYGNQEGKLEHDFVVAPGADPNVIAIGLRDNDAVVPDKNGDLTCTQKPEI